MRTIKFRAWHKKEKFMHSVAELSWHVGGIKFYGPGAGRGDFGEFELMQYTGLKDKNGEEIFEGHIIRIEHPHKNRNFEGTVEFIGHQWNCKDFYFPHFDNPNDIFSEGTEYIEIIGNIYERQN